MNKDELIKLVETYPKQITDLRTTIRTFVESIDHYPVEWPLFKKAYHELFLGGSAAEVMCPVCHNKALRFKGLRHGYVPTCSYSCRNKSPEFIRKYKDSCMKRYGTEYASQSLQFRNAVEKTCLEKYGVKSVMQNEQVKEKLKSSFIEKFGVDNPSKNQNITRKIKQARIGSGDWVPDECRSDLEKYRMLVKKLTAKSYHDHFYKINPANLPRSRYQYSLDHIFSVEEGFKQNIPAEVISHWTNLRLMWHLENSKKNTKCHKTKEQLYEDYSKSID